MMTQQGKLAFRRCRPALPSPLHHYQFHYRHHLMQQKPPLLLRLCLPPFRRLHS